MKRKIKSSIRVHRTNMRQKLPKIVILFAMLILLAVPVQSAFSQFSPEDPKSTTVAWDIQEVDAPPYFYNMSNRSLAYRNDDVPCVAYGYEALYYSCYDSVSELWVTETVDNDLRVGEYASLAFNNEADPNGTSRPFISYYDAENGRLKLAYNLGFGWQILVVDSIPPGSAPQELTVSKERTFQDDIDDFLQPWFSPELGGRAPDIDLESFGVGKHTSIDVDRNNNVHISYYDEVNRSLKYAYWQGGPWEYKVVHDYADQGVTGLWTSIIVDEDFNVNISYRDEKYNNLRYSRCKGSVDGDGCAGWIHEDVDTSGDVGSFTSIALDSDNKPHISYYDVGNANLKHAVRNGKDDWSKGKVDDSGYVGWYTSIAINSKDKIQISYYKPGNGTLKYASLDDGDTSWEIKTLVDWSNKNLGLFTSIALGEDELPGIVYYNMTDGILHYINRKEGGGWNNPTNIEINSRDVGQATSLTIDKDSVPYISYFDASGGYLMMARSYGQYWGKSPVIIDPPAGLYSSIKLKDDYIPRIGFYNSYDRDLMYGYLDYGVWRFENIDTTNKVGKYVSMDLDSNQIPHISYYDATNEDLVYATWNSGWFTQTLDYEGDVGLYTSIILDSYNRPYISYYDNEKKTLKIAYKSIIGAWIIETVDDGGIGVEPDVGQYTSIGLEVVGLSEYPHISYYDYTNGNLKYAYWNGSSWVISVLDSSVDDIGRFSSLVIDPSTNDRHLSYLDGTNGDLKYAFWDDSSSGPWAFEIVDSLGDVGYYSSIALNSSGDPAISYYDNTLGNLKIALGFALPNAKVYLPLMVK